jgi:tRNA (cytidine/uridine-2'-O-)-methyltransferase
LARTVTPTGSDFFSNTTKRKDLSILPLPWCMAFRCESRGLPERFLKGYPERVLQIPIRPQARCLNLANAVAIAVYEGVRQLGQ